MVHRYKFKPLFPLATSLLFCFAACLAFMPMLTKAQGVYSPGGWATLHAGPGNRKLVQGVELAQSYRSRVVLEGSSVLTAPTMSPAGDAFYVTTGQGQGMSNLHAFTVDGDFLWASTPVDEGAKGAAAGVDGCAILSSPIVDTEGDIYISDCDQLWAYKPDGSVKWVVDQPVPPENSWQPAGDLKINAFTTAVFTNEGYVLGVTNYGSVSVHDRETGERVADPLLLPGLQPPLSEAPQPDSMLAEGLMNPALRIWAWQLLMGGAMPSANTPAVDVNTGRIFVAVSSTTPGQGALVGLDIVPQDDGRVVIDIAWSTDMGPGSGSSPSLSPDGKQVYVSDEEGMFYGISTATGEVLWQLQTKSAAASVAVGADGTVYSLQQYAPAIIAMSPDGERLWESDVGALVKEKLSKHILLGEPIGSGSGNPTVVGDEVLVPVSYGFNVNLAGRRVPLYVTSTVVALDTKTGLAVRDIVALPDDSSGITVVLEDGTILSSLGAVVSSSVAPLRGLFNWMMPGDYELLDVTGGLNIARPE